MKAALIYGSCTGKTEYIADEIIDSLKPEIELALIDVSSLDAPDLKNWDFVVCGIPTWDIGELEYGWQDVYDKLDGVDLSGLHVAMFGLGDQCNYPDTYQDAMGILYEKLLECGAIGKIGFTAVEGHDFEASLAVVDEQFCGLAIDEDNQDHLTESRIKSWAKQIKQDWNRLQVSPGEEVCS